MQRPVELPVPLVGTLSAEALPVLFALGGTRDVADVADEYRVAESDLCERLLPQLRDLGMRGLLRRATSG